MNAKNTHFRHVLRSVAGATLIAAGLVCQTEAAVRRQVPVHIADRLDGILEPYEQGASQIVHVTLSKPNSRYVEGDLFAFEIETRGRASYVYIDYFQLDGTVVHVLPSPALEENFMRKGASVAIGTPNSEIVYDVLPPFGRELLVVIATSSPLFDEPRQEFEDAQSYLDALVSGLARAAATARKPAVVFRFINTYPRNDAPAEFGTAQTGAAETGAAEAGAAETRAAATAEPPILAADADVEAEAPSWNQQTTAPRPLPDTAKSAGDGKSTTALPSAKTDDFYTLKVVPLLARKAKHPEGNENAAALDRGDSENAEASWNRVIWYRQDGKWQ